ncbi:MAG TPA: carboxypeptidase-like regulatory domain-containing protein [Candidatus Acidoferrales bacterium]|nr:carboxypeptidase-like regulatory domain-containing protein [Candidatus Acidoferrales bacterium]
MAQRLGRLVILLTAALLFLVPGLARGQARTEGQLSGTVVDPSDATIPEATLTITETSTGFATTVTASSSGAYVFPDLQPGTYTLTASAKGFASGTYHGVVIYAGRTTDLKVQLKVGTAAETVEVSAQGEVLETTTNTLATTVSGDTIQNLPLNGRDALPFAQLMPGAQVGGDQRFTTYDAMPNGAINISIDGTNDNFSRFRTSTTGFFTGAGLRIGAVDEMTVSTDQLGADAAAEGAVTINVTTKHGTNEFHGNGFWEAYNSAFNANSYGNDTYLYDAKQLATADPGTSAAYLASGRKQPSHVNDFGGSIGGPILKNKLFFFVNYEREHVPQTSLTTTEIPNQAAQNGNFTYIRADNGQPQTVNLYNIAAADAGACNCGLASSINSNIQSLLSTVNGFASKGTLAPNTTDPLLSTLMNNLSFPYDNSYTQVWPTARIDFLIKPNVTWHTSYNMYWRTFAGTPIYPGDSVLESSFQSTYSTFATGLDWTIKPTLVNQINFGVLNEQEEFQHGNSFSAFQGIVYLPVASGLGGPGGSVFTPPVPDSGSILPEPRNSPVRNVTDNLTWTRGNHTITFGGEFRYSTAFDTGTFPPIAQNLGISSVDPAAGMFNTSAVSGCTSDTQGCFPGGLGTANNNEALADAEALYTLLTGRVSSISGNVPLNNLKKPYAYTPGGQTKLEEEFKEGGLYIQDAWKITPHLALNYGLRFQFTGPITNTNDYFTGPTFANLLGPSSALFQPGVLNGVANPQIALRPQPYGGDYKQPAPRFGFAWNPDFENGFLGKLAGGSKTVIRGGYAINYYDEGTIPWESVAQGGLASESFFLNAGQFAPGSISFDPANPAVTSINSFPNTGGQFITPLPESEFTFTGLGSFSTVDPKIRTPYIQNWSFGIQRQFAGSWVIELNYVGNHAVHMWDAYDLNEVNIFQNASGFDSFLQDFQNAQANLAASGGATFSGPNPTPILTQAFGGAGSSAFTNPSFLFDVQTGQAGALAGAITQAPSYFCNLVGNTFSPCVLQGYVAAGQAPTPLTYPINFFQVNPYGGGNGLEFLSDPGSETYNGLHVNVKHPVGHGLNFMADYAYSHAFTNRYLGDYFSADSAEADFYTLRDPHLNRVPSPYDLRHTFNALLTYQLPFGAGKAFDARNSMINRVIGGWTVGGIFTWQIGRNFKLAGGQDTYNWFDTFNINNSFGFPPDPNDSGVVLNGVTVSQLQSQVTVRPAPTITDAGVTIPDPSIQALMFPTSEFGPGGAIQPESTPGVIAPPIFLHGPMFVNTDLSLTKNIPIWERVSMEIHAEFINAFNHPSFNYTDGYSFGTNNPAQYLFVNFSPYSPLTVGQGGNRQIQFRAQIVF